MCTKSLYLEKVVASKQLKFAMETDVERKAKLEKMVATTQLRLAQGTEEERRAKINRILFPKDAAMRKKWADQVKQCALFKAGLFKCLLHNIGCSVDSHLYLYRHSSGSCVN